jgi:hypothetical protein
VTGTALRKPLMAALKAVQVKPRPKLWNALRASRVAELREDFPAHVVDAWMGHDEKVARKHYAQTLDYYFTRALQKSIHFAASTDAHQSAPPTEDAEKSAQYGTAQHGEVGRWAMRDSNPRHPRCKRGALAN